MTLYPEWPAVGADALEQTLLETWQEENLFRAVQNQTAAGTPFVFYEGPPTANGRPGIHHVFARTIKDLVCRFRVMQGRRVTRKAGWDTHGLPVEIEVEKELKLNGKKAIEEYGVAAFNAKARESVFKYKDEWQKLSERTGYWLDYSDPYVTCSNEYIESVWWLLKRLHERGLLVRGHRVLPYCPRCGTTLSSHELALGYQEIEDNSVYVTFVLESKVESGKSKDESPKSKDESQKLKVESQQSTLEADAGAFDVRLSTSDSGRSTHRELVVWTTTPWTLPSNVAVAVHPELEYGEYAYGDRVLIAATARAPHIKVPSGPSAPVPPGDAAGRPGSPHTLASFPLRRTFVGQELVGLRYQRPLDVVALPSDRVSQVVVPGEFVTAEDGSGIVHLAPAFGADDYDAGKLHDLAMLRPVAADGTFQGTTWAELEGMLVTHAKTNDLIIARLKQSGRLLHKDQHRHSYPHCWRCGSKLIYVARDSWFVRTSAVKQRMLELNVQVGWHPPEVGTGRFGEWLENNVDWALSRDRYWGTPLPVWVSDRDPSYIEVIGSYQELAEKAGKPLPRDFDPHKPFIDAYTWPAPGGGTMRRAPEVIDTWFDSGAMPFAQWHYPFEHEQEFAEHFPADFICEGVDQTRGWFYSLLAIAATAFDAGAYRNVVVNELVLDAEGQKMSKSKGNVADPWAAVSQFGADTVRLYLLASSQVWLPRRFDAAGMAEQAGTLNTLRQTYAFFQRYAGDWKPGHDRAVELTALDRWLLARLDALVDQVTTLWSDYEVTAGVREVLSFVTDDLSNWYVRLSRDRFWAPDGQADDAALSTLHEALVTVARLLAPAAPFVSDWLHRALEGTSVHLARFPEPRGRRDARLEPAMDAIRRLASLARAAREDGKLRVRQPLRTLQVAVPATHRGEQLHSLFDILKAEVNVKEVKEAASDHELVRLVARPNFRSLGKRFGKETQKVATAVASLETDALRRLEAGESVQVDGLGEILPEDVAVQREVTSDWLVASDGPFVAALDHSLDDALRSEGIAREVVNRAQRIRRDAGYEFTTRIDLFVRGDTAVVDAVERHRDYIARETLARSLETGQLGDPLDLVQDVDIDGMQAAIGVRRHRAA